jgi:hypothetical protein
MNMRTHRNELLAAGVFLLVALFMTAPAWGDEVTITGTVTEEYQIIEEGGETYNIADDPIGEEMVAEAAGKTVEVTGTLEEDDTGEKTIVVEEYNIQE